MPTHARANCWEENLVTPGLSLFLAGNLAEAKYNRLPKAGAAHFRPEENRLKLTPLAGSVGLVLILLGAACQGSPSKGPPPQWQRHTSDKLRYFPQLAHLAIIKALTPRGPTSYDLSRQICAPR